MKEFDSELNRADIERYLYGEMTDAERAAAEEKLFADDEFFYTILDQENSLVDAYARGEMKSAEELARFERSLEFMPERRAKVANARALANFIEQEKPQAGKAAAAEIKETFAQKLARFFSIQTPAFSYAMAGLLVLFAVSSVFLFIDNRRQANDLARLENSQPNVFGQKEKDLQKQIADAAAREAELKNRIDGERAAGSDLTDELERERQRRAGIETELERLRRDKSNGAARPTPNEQPAPIVASILLAPGIATRGGGTTAAPAQNLVLEQGTKRVAVRLALPEGLKAGERFGVALNGKTVAADLIAAASNGGRIVVQFTVAPADLLDGANALIVANTAGAEISRYVLSVRKK